MNKPTCTITVILCFILSCSIIKTKDVPEKQKSGVELKDFCIDKFTPSTINTLKRYLAGNYRWDYREERGKTYAFMKQIQHREQGISKNGFYSVPDNSIYQTRVAISFGNYLGFENNDNITFTDTDNKKIKLNIFTGIDCNSCFNSYLIIKNDVMNIEIFEKSKTIKRTFSQETITKLNEELLSVLKYEKEIEEEGISPESVYYPVKYDSPFFTITDGSQPGIYLLNAALHINEPGKIYPKIYDVKYNNRLSEKFLSAVSAKEIGWSKHGKNVFHYEVEIRIIEGAYSDPYEARFELWFLNRSGQEKKMAEKVKSIKGWDRKSLLNK